MAKIVFAAISPHPPLILPSVGSSYDRAKVKKTIEALKDLGSRLKKEDPDEIIISSPHPDWGFNVPLFFLAKSFKGKITSYLVGADSPEEYFLKGKETAREFLSDGSKKRIALIASGDTSHCLKEDGPYGFNPDGPKFDKALIESLKERDLKKTLKLDRDYPQAAECGLRSFSFLLGILEQSKINYQADVLSYEAPFGVGYLVANFKIS